MKVVFTVLDALPGAPRGRSEHTPVLTALAQEVGVAPGRARAVMTDGHVTRTTRPRDRDGPREHGIAHQLRAAHRWLHPGVGDRPRCDAVRRVPGAGRSSAAVVGDQCLIGVMGARAADTHWPPNGEIPADRVRDAHDYIDDADTVVELARAVDERPDLVVSQLNAPDTTAHVHGPDSDAALATYRETDAQLATVRDHLDWNDTVWIVVSDHDQETVVDHEPIDLRPAFRASGSRPVRPPEGSATVVCGEARSTRHGGCPRWRASRARRRSTSPTPSSRRVWRGVCPGARSGSPSCPPSPGPTAAHAPARRWPWSPVVTRPRHASRRAPRHAR